MGLDMYLVGVKFPDRYSHKMTKKTLEDGFEVRRIEVELGYWRKHPNLHGYIVNTFASGKDECQQIDLSKENLENIITAVNEKRLPHTEGFFFGQSYNNEEEREKDIKIILGALKWLEPSGDKSYRRIYYQASW